MCKIIDGKNRGKTRNNNINKMEQNLNHGKIPPVQENFFYKKRYLKRK
jgi:hypothetical protein